MIGNMFVGIAMLLIVIVVVIVFVMWQYNDMKKNKSQDFNTLQESLYDAKAAAKNTFSSW